MATNNNFSYIFNIYAKYNNVTAVVDKVNAVFGKTTNTVNSFNNKVSNSFNTISEKLSGLRFSNFLTQVNAVTDGLNSLAAPGLQFGSSMADLSALTGITGKELEELGAKAKASASEFGGSASASLETYKTILGRLGPDIAQNKEALSGMERNVQILSKTMGGDSAGAVDALTTAMLQFGVDLSNPAQATAEMTKMMDVMANAAQEGAAEVPSIAEALKVSGVAMKQAKVSFIEGNAAIQALAQGGKEGSEAGVALRNVLGKMAGEDVIPKDAADKLKRLGVDMNVVSDTSLPLTDRLRELRKAQGDATIMAQVFGVQNAAAADILLSSIDAQEEYADKIGKVGGAMEQASIIMESPAEKIKRVQANIENFKISISTASGGLLGYAGVIGDVAKEITNLAPLYDVLKGGIMGTIKAVTWLTKAENLKKIAMGAGAVVTGIVTAAQWLWNLSMWASPITWIIMAVIALIGVIVFLVTKVTGWGEAWKHTVNGAKLLWEAFTTHMKWAFDSTVDGIMIGINKIQQGWYKFKNTVGIGDSEENNKMLQQIQADTDRRKKEIKEGAVKVVQLYKESGEEFIKAGQSLSIKKSKDKIGASNGEGIAPPDALLGAVPKDGKPTATDGTSGKKDKTNESIATGGTKNTVINITMKSMVELVQIMKGNGFKESAQDMEEELTDAMLRTLAMAASTAG